MRTDIEIARETKVKPITEIARKSNIPSEALSQYGNLIAKVNIAKISDNKKKSKLILVTAIHPTPAGEGKTTVSIGLADAMRYNGKDAMLALREPSLGPVFGLKGGATGGGMSQVLPMDKINLHFTGDLHAITSANNLLAAMLDNHIQQGNELNIDPRQVKWRRCMDTNDRQLRNIISGLGSSKDGVPRQDGFNITAASEIMAVFCLASDIWDLKMRLGRIVVARTYSGKPVTADDIKAAGAMVVLLKDAFQPNLVQTLESTPVLIHGGPFANIAHGCNSVIATKTALKMADYVVTEAGFAADLGAEKFLDIKCRMNDLWPNAVIMVATIRALKYHGGAVKEDLNKEDIECLQKGMDNLFTHIERIRSVYKVPVIVAINKFYTDTDAEITELKNKLSKKNISCELSDAYSNGGKGAAKLAEMVCEIVDNSKDTIPSFAYENEDSIKTKIEKVAKKIYGADGVEYSGEADANISQLEAEGYGKLPVCIAKTQYSFSDDAKKINVAKNFKISVRKIDLSAGAGFLVVFAGNIIAMPGLSKYPAANNIDIDDKENIVGLF